MKRKQIEAYVLGFAAGIDNSELHDNTGECAMLQLHDLYIQ